MLRRRARRRAHTLRLAWVWAVFHSPTFPSGVHVRRHPSRGRCSQLPRTCLPCPQPNLLPTRPPRASRSRSPSPDAPHYACLNEVHCESCASGRFHHATKPGEHRGGCCGQDLVWTDCTFEEEKGDMRRWRPQLSPLLPCRIDPRVRCGQPCAHPWLRLQAPRTVCRGTLSTWTRS